MKIKSCGSKHKLGRKSTVEIIKSKTIFFYADNIESIIKGSLDKLPNTYPFPVKK
jgi:hypothetical protein